MTALPEHPFELPPAPDHLLAIAEYAELGEPQSGYTELIEGRIMTSPSPKPRHNRASGRIYLQLVDQLPGHLDVIQDVDIDLQLAPEGQPAFSRRPDLVIVETKAIDRVDAEGGILRASEVLIVLEIVAPGSRHIDCVDKHLQYADAEIPYYWIVDLTEPVSVEACHLAGEFGYQNAPAVTGVFAADEPLPLRLDLQQLL